MALVLLDLLHDLFHLLAYRHQSNAKTTSSRLFPSLVLVTHTISRLASMFVTFAIEHFIYEPILISCFGDKQLVRERGGSFYNFRLGEAFKASQNN